MVEIHEDNIILVKTNDKEVKDSLKAISLLGKRVKKSLYRWQKIQFASTCQ